MFHLKSGTTKLSLDSEQIDIEFEELLQYLECPVCTDLQLGPIYNCEQGHSVCNECLEKLTECPICKSPFTTSRNYLAESIADALLVKCPYEEAGCMVKSKMADRESHSSECGYRPIVCKCRRWPPCRPDSNAISLLDYPKHLTVRHELKQMEFGEVGRHEQILYKSDQPAHIWDPCCFLVQEKAFHLMTMLKNGNLHWWISMVSPDVEEAQEYSCTIVIFNNDMEFSYKLPVHHFRKLSNDEIVEKGACASLPHSNVTPFCTKFSYSVHWDVKFSVGKKSNLN